MQNHPDQLTDAMRNRPDRFVVAETRNETTVEDLEDASFTFDGSARTASIPGTVRAGFSRTSSDGGVPDRNPVR